MKKTISILALVLSLSSCVTIDYLGKNYIPTSDVQMYFDQADISRDFEVMGMLTAEAPEIIRSSKVQQRIMERARAMGADAVLFESLGKKISGTISDYNEDPYGGFATTSTTEDKVVQAKFIKYRL